MNKKNKFKKTLWNISFCVDTDFFSLEFVTINLVFLLDTWIESKKNKMNSEKKVLKRSSKKIFQAVLKNKEINSFVRKKDV